MKTSTSSSTRNVLWVAAFVVPASTGASFLLGGEGLALSTLIASGLILASIAFVLRTRIPGSTTSQSRSVLVAGVVLGGAVLVAAAGAAAFGEGHLALVALVAGLLAAGGGALVAALLRSR